MCTSWTVDKEEDEVSIIIPEPASIMAMSSGGATS
jgi:hypothetical protein